MDAQPLLKGMIQVVGDNPYGMFHALIVVIFIRSSQQMSTDRLVDSVVNVFDTAVVGIRAYRHRQQPDYL